MIVLIFDLDDTLLMSNEYNNYNDIKFNTKLLNLLNQFNNHKFIYTNGTYGHAEKSIPKLLGNNIFKKIYARDTIPFMKPDYKSFNYINNNIFYNINNNINNYKNISYIFFDDNLDNIESAKHIGWTTIWIPHRNYENEVKKTNYEFVDYKYYDIYNALENLNNIIDNINNNTINYIQSNYFKGYKKGYYFKKGINGLGYYIDNNN